MGGDPKFHNVVLGKWGDTYENIYRFHHPPFTFAIKNCWLNLSGEGIYAGLPGVILNQLDRVVDQPGVSRRNRPEGTLSRGRIVHRSENKSVPSFSKPFG